MNPLTDDNYKICTKYFFKRLLRRMGKHSKADRSQRRVYFRKLNLEEVRIRSLQLVILPEMFPNCPG